MWRAYYGHRFVALVFILICLFKEQFKVNTFIAIRLGYYSGKAAMIFRRSGNVEQTLHYLELYYDILNRHSTHTFDAHSAASAELEWWMIHRYPKKYKTSLAEGLAKAMAILYHTKPKSLMQHANERAAAMKFRDTATHIDKVEPDWHAIEQHLRASYEALHDAVNH